MSAELSEKLSKVDYRDENEVDDAQKVIELMMGLPTPGQQPNGVHDGSYTWIIHNGLAMIDNAKPGEQLASQAFLTKQFGYMMRCELYLNGVGTGNVGHVSAFLVVLRGEYDAVLQWPIQPTCVRATFVNKEPDKTLVRSITPDPYQRDNPNLRQGWPQFMPTSQLTEDGFVFDDGKLFIKIEVEI